MSKKHLIMEKAIELFSEQGIEATSVQQITELCGISKGAFYLHFKSKDELITCIIDYFMTNIIADIEQAVSEETHDDQLLYRYLYISFKSLQKQVNSAKFFLNEQVFTFNKDLFERIQMYMSLINKILFKVIQRQFSKTRLDLHLDILFTVNGLAKSYTELLLIDDNPTNIDLFCKAIVEKTKIIAEHATISFLTPEYLEKTDIQLNISKEMVIQRLEEAISESEEDPLILESLHLLLEELHSPKFNEVIIQGLLNNIRTKRHYRWIAYIYQIYRESI